ncbi:5-methyltetrahydropteroyltriglutamate-homocysteine methyltransferase [Rhizodiscina lignyota]|uniref:5-methyltetrahydropteroyltriglutamate-homocysteine methyltransferase n=1 Tax=Rhizodiscina lignyota TaxID=1504668 RepID=A0A9P4I5H5_9PEZI|nr:5-methyltetrahydropteroyltriglutamate-homocysteine methyltransferase [Rhizodiscina lignyota]
MSPSFHTEQIGSLLRPEGLLSARAASNLFYYAPTAPEDIKRETEAAIARVVRKQQDLGIRPITDGEYGRFVFSDGFFERLEGFKAYQHLPVPDAFRTNYPPSAMLMKLGVKTRPAAVAEGKIRHKESSYLEQWKALRALLPESEWKLCKVTMPALSHQHIGLRPGRAYSTSAYNSDEEYFGDLAAAYRQEIRMLYEAGVRNIQVDDPQLTFLLMESFRNGIAIDGGDANDLLETYKWASNEALKDKPEDLHVGIHLCRGNFPGSVHVAEGSYEWLAQRLFSTTKYDTFYLEYDTPRAGSFSPLRYLPIGKNVVLGLVSTKSPTLEDLDLLEKRVYEAADIIAEGQGRTRQEVIENSLAVSPQCGFSSISVGGGAGVTEEVMWEKLLLVKRLAERIWGVS